MTAVRQDVQGPDHHRLLDLDRPAHHWWRGARSLSRARRHGLTAGGCLGVA